MKNIMSMTMSEGSFLYEAFRYPAGEWQVRLTPAGLDMLDSATEVRITAHINSGDDLMRLACLKSAVGGVHSSVPTSLLLPYLPYGRADRRFVPGDCMGLNVFASMIEAMQFHHVLTVDAHSAQAELSMLALESVSPMPLIERAIAKFAGVEDGITVLFPDEGAAKRYEIPSSLGSNSASIQIQHLFCSKKRDAATGNLSGFNVPARGAFEWDKALIVDDICDGGGTFIGIADELAGHGLELGLYVTHGIFSKGTEDLAQRFSRIYATDSMGHSHRNGVETFPCGPTVWKAAPCA